MDNRHLWIRSKKQHGSQYSLQSQMADTSLQIRGISTIVKRFGRFPKTVTVAD
jgi:hypothetical protein